MVANNIKTIPNTKNKGCLSMEKIISKYGIMLRNNVRMFKKDCLMSYFIYTAAVKENLSILK